MKSLTYVFIFAACLILVPSKAALDCFQCTGDKCDSEFPDKKPCEKDGDVCFVKNESGKITRGCTAEADCTGDNCKVCKDSGCNNQLICQTCDGSDNCARVSAPLDVKICDSGITKCFTQINNDKKTVRGCATKEITDSCKGETCETCDKANCNNALYPSGRLLCYQCNDSKCDKPTDEQSFACTNYDKSDKCFTSGTSDTTMIRGCASDKDAKCTQNGDNCLVCEGNKCNDRQFTRDQKLKCYQCDSKTKPECLSNPSNDDLKSCTKGLDFTVEESCFIQTKDGVTYRGCLYDTFSKSSDCTKDTNCQTCGSADGCNKESTTFQCIECRNDIDPKCWNEADKLPGKDCKQKEGDKCYHWIDGGLTIRGCLSDAWSQTAAACEAGKGCQLCNTSKCNIGKSGAISWSFSIPLTLAMISIWRLF